MSPLTENAVSFRVYQYVEKKMSKKPRSWFGAREVAEALEVESSGAISGALHRLTINEALIAKQDPDAPRRQYIYKVKNVRAIREVMGSARKHSRGGRQNGAEDKKVREYLDPTEFKARAESRIPRVFRTDPVIEDTKPTDRSLVDRIKALEGQIGGLRETVQRLSRVVGI